MGILKFYATIILAVISSLLYVHQHVEIVKSNYILKENEMEVAQLLDRNEALMYNIEKLENPSLLEERLHSDETVFTVPEKWYIASSGKRNEKAEIVSAKEAKRTIFDFLIPKALAQVKPAR